MANETRSSFPGHVSLSHSRMTSHRGMISTFMLVPIGIAVSILMSVDVVQAQINDATIKTIDGRTLVASIVSMDDTGLLRTTGQELNLSVDDIVTMETKVQRDTTTRRIHVLTANGSELGVDRVEVSTDQVRLILDDQTYQLSLQTIRALVWKPSELIQSAIREPSKQFDQVFVEIDGVERNVEGILESVSTDGVGINYQGKSRKIGLDKLTAIVTADLTSTAPTGPQARIRTSDGNSWVGRPGALTDNRWELMLTPDSKVAIVASSVMQVAIQSDRIKYLSDLDPVAVRENSLASVSRSYQRNLSVSGNPMTIRGSDPQSQIHFNKGIGVQATSELLFANEDGFDRFRATVGIDLETEGRGDCEVVVRGDGIELWKQRVRGGAAPQSIDVDIQGIKQVSLSVNPGREFDLADHVDWGDARFLKTKQ